MTTQTNADPKTKFGSDPESSNNSKPRPVTQNEMAQHIDHGESSYKGIGKLTGRKAIITGGDSDIGRAVAIAFARRGRYCDCLPGRA
jgi:hypothetical protein